MGNIYTTGWFRRNLTIPLADGTWANLEAYRTSFGDTRDVFVMKLNASGIPIWVRSFGGFNSDEGRAIDVDLATGDSFVAGDFSETMNVRACVSTTTHIWVCPWCAGK